MHEIVKLADIGINIETLYWYKYRFRLSFFVNKQMQTQNLCFLISNFAFLSGMTNICS